MKKDTSARSFDSARRGCLSGSIAALLAGLAILGSGAANAIEEGPPPPAPATFWLGQNNGIWAQQNWASNATGAPTTATPIGASDITFSATGAQNQTTLLGQDFTIHSLTINDPVAVTINGLPSNIVPGSPNTLTITGPNAITVNSGAGLFTINANVAFSGASTIVTVNNTAGAVVNGVISGPSSLTKAGAGSLDLTGINTYTGNTIVSAGSLFVDGAIASANTFVQAGGLIGGHGTINGNLVNGGIVSPGNSPGTLTIGGNYTQSPAGTLVIQIGGLAPTQHDLLAVGGVATLGGTLQLQQLNNFTFSPGQAITFLTAAGGINGTFSTVINGFAASPLIGEQVIYLPGSGIVEAVQLPITSIPGETPNERVVAWALDHVLFDPRFAGIISRLDSEPLDKILSDLNNFGPAILTSIFEIEVSEARVQTFNLERRLEDVRWGSNGFSASGFAMNGATPGPGGPLGDVGFLGGPDGKAGKTVMAPAPNNRWGFFITGVGEFSNLGDTFNARGYDLTNAGFTLGADYRFTDHLVIGVAAGYEHSDVDPNAGGRITADGARLALYGTAFTGKGLYTNFAVQGGYDSYDTARAAVGGTARATTDGGQFDALFGTGYDWKFGGLTIGPTANFEYTYVGLGGADERGSLGPLSFPNQSQNSIRTTLGAKASYDWKIGGLTVIPELRLGWQHEYGDNTFQFLSQFEQGGPAFTVQGPETGRDSLIVGAGFAIRWNERVSTYVYYDGELGRTNYESNNVSGGFRIEF